MSFMHSFLLIASSQALVSPLTGMAVHSSEWLRRNRYSLPLIGLAFYYSGYAIIEGFSGEPFLIVVLLTVPLLGGLAVRNGRIIVFGDTLVCLKSTVDNAPFQILFFYPDYGPGWILSGTYIAFSGFIFMLSMVAWIMSMKRRVAVYIVLSVCILTQTWFAWIFSFGTYGWLYAAFSGFLLIQAAIAWIVSTDRATA